MRRIARFLRLPRSAARIRAEVDEEIRFDVEMRAQDLVRRGMTPDAAHDAALREFGDVDATRRSCEDIDMQIESETRRTHLLEDLRSDIVIALRGMRRTPLFAAVVLLTLGLGIGANTAIFSVVERVLIAPLPFRAPEQLHRLYTAPSATGDFDKLSAVELTDLAAQSRSIEGIALFGNYGGLTYSNETASELWQSVSVAPNFFSVLGVRPVIGRVFRADDFVQGAPLVVMITYQTWQRTFGGTHGIVNRTLDLNGKPAIVIGVLPERFVGPTFKADMLLPLHLDEVLRNPSFARSRVWRSVARLKPGVSLEQWRRELEVLRPRLAASYPEIKNAGVVLPMPLHEAIVGSTGPVLRLAMGGALLVLIATCVSIAGLFLSRAIARRRELGVRTALGAGRERLIRQVLVETLLYGVGGGLLGVLLAFVFKAALLRIAAPMLPQLGEVRIDAMAMAFALAASVAAGVVFGLAPALAATRVDVRTALHDGAARGTSRGEAASRTSRFLVSTQVAFAVVLLVGAGLFVRTFNTLVDTDLGYATTSHQVAFFVGLGSRYPEAPARRAFLESFAERVRALPGVTAVGSTVTTPWSGTWRNIKLDIDGRPSDGGERPTVALATASWEFFDAMGMRIRAGRGFSTADRPGTAPVVVINENMAKRLWPGKNPIGARIRLDRYASNPADSTLTQEVVGVVSDARQDAMTDPVPTVYVSSEQAQFMGSAYVARTTGDGRQLLAQIKSALTTLDARAFLISPRTLDDVLSDLVRRQNVARILIGMFAALALLLAGLGIYGIMAYSVAARTRELGIRAALGASRADIAKLILGDAATTTVVGVLAGVGIAAVLSRVVASMLVGVTAHDPLSYAAAVVVLGVVVLIACAAPVRATTRIEPVEALRLD